MRRSSGVLLRRSIPLFLALGVSCAAAPALAVGPAPDRPTGSAPAPDAAPGAQRPAPTTHVAAGRRRTPVFVPAPAAPRANVPRVATEPVTVKHAAPRPHRRVHRK